MTPHRPHIAIVGSGPAGCYLAQGLLRALPDAQVTVFDRLASPFGLVRYGVAADHQHTKSIIRQFERLFQSPNVRFAGNVEVGEHIGLDELRTHFDIVALATGLSDDRQLDVPGSELAGVYAAGDIIQPLNAHPIADTDFPNLGGRVLLIGSGNVAIDILRFLVKDASGYDGSDIVDEMLDRYLTNPATEITVVSRSPAPFAKSDPKMIKELAHLARARYESPDLNTAATTDAIDARDRESEARVSAYEELTSSEREPYNGPLVHLRFGLTPTQIVGDSHVESVEFASSTGLVTIAADSVVTAIGFEGRAADEISRLTSSPSDSGRVEPGLYRTGWARRGATGAIPENRACAKSVVAEILADLQGDVVTVSPTRTGFDAVSPEIRDQSVSYEQWLRIDRHERETAATGRVRRKVHAHEQMVSIAQDSHSTLR